MENLIYNITFFVKMQIITKRLQNICLTIFTRRKSIFVTVFLKNLIIIFKDNRDEFLLFCTKY